MLSRFAIGAGLYTTITWQRRLRLRPRSELPEPFSGCKFARAPDVHLSSANSRRFNEASGPGPDASDCNCVRLPSTNTECDAQYKCALHNRSRRDLEHDC